MRKIDNVSIMNSIEAIKQYVNNKVGNDKRHYAHLIVSDKKYIDYYDTYIFLNMDGVNSYILLEGNFSRFITKSEINVRDNEFKFIAGTLTIQATNHLGQTFSISITPANK